MQRKLSILVFELQKKMYEYSMAWSPMVRLYNSISFDFDPKWIVLFGKSAFIIARLIQPNDKQTLYLIAGG